MADRLAAIMGGPTGTLAQLVTQLQNVQGVAPFNSLADVSADVRRLEATIDSNWPLMMGRLGDMLELLDSVAQVLGAAPYSSTETGNLRALMLAMVACCAKKGQLPDDLGEDYTQSAGSVTLNGRRYVKWGSVPGLITGNEPGLPAQTLLAPVGTWAGYRIFFQTDAPQVNAEGTGETFPANSWFTLPGAAPWTWYVPASYSIVGFIRPPEGMATDYEHILADNLNLNTWFVTIPGYERDGADMLGDGSGHSFRFVVDPANLRTSGGPGGVGDPRIAWEPGVGRLTYNQFDVDTWYHFSGATTSFAFYSYYGTFALDWANGLMAGSIAADVS
jgi:hypothetical protein